MFFYITCLGIINFGPDIFSILDGDDNGVSLHNGGSRRLATNGQVEFEAPGLGVVNLDAVFFSFNKIHEF